MADLALPSLPQGWEHWAEPRKILLRNSLRQTKYRATYEYDPEAWLHDCIEWREGEVPLDYQVRALVELYENLREAIRGPHGPGKSAIGAFAILHFSTTRDGDDWKLPTTASVGRQLFKFLWPEVHKWQRRLKWSVLGREPFIEGKELLQHGLKLSTGEAFAVAPGDPSAMEGAHADRLLYVYDEAREIDAGVFEATEGAFAGAGPDTGREAFGLALSTPGDPVGPFYAMHRRDPRYLDWHPMQITLEEAIAAGRISAAWVEKCALAWGRESALFKRRVLGEFAASDEEAMIPLRWVELANERWEDMVVDLIDPQGGVTKVLPQELLDELKWKGVGVDVSDQGEDQTVLALRYGDVITDLRRIPFDPDPMETAGHVVAVLRPRGGLAVIDGIGVGSGVVARCREQGIPVDSFIANERSDRVDRTGEFGFVDRRAEAWQGMRELLDPSQPGGSDVALPPDDLLLGDLTTPKGKMTSSGKLRVEDKDAIRKRIGRSPDDGDAVVMIFNLKVQHEEVVRPSRPLTPRGPRGIVTT